MMAAYSVPLQRLRWEDIDFETKVIHVRQRADAWGTMDPGSASCRWKSAWFRWPHRI
jgi:hypothetical protein